MTDEIDRVLALAEHTPERGRRALPALPLRRARADRAPGRASSTASSSRTPPSRRPACPQRPAYPSPARARRCGTACTGSPTGCPPCSAAATGIGSNALGGLRRALRDRRAAARQRPAPRGLLPGIWMQMGLHCRTVVRGLPARRRRASPSPASRAWSSATTPTSPGASPTSAPTSATSTSSGSTATAGGTTAGWRPLRTRTETIEVRDGERRGAHRPLDRARTAPLRRLRGATTEVGEQAPVDHPEARGRAGTPCRWRGPALEPAPTADAILAPQPRHRLGRRSGRPRPRFAVPAQNMVYADREGHIGYQAPGRIPIRKSGNDGYLPAEGWRPDDDWTGDYVPFEGLPNVLDPEEGFVVTANQAVTGPDYPFHLTDDWDRGYRSQRIRDVIARGGRALGRRDGGAAARRPQPDRARAGAPTCSSIELPARLLRTTARSCSVDWDFAQAADSAGGGVLQRGVAQPARADLPRRAARGGLARRRRALDRRRVAACSRSPADPWWDDATTDGRGRDPRRHPAQACSARRATS